MVVDSPAGPACQDGKRTEIRSRDGGGVLVVTWTPDLRHQKTYGTLTLTPERNGGETAHRVDIPGGLSVRALPDGRTSGQKRSHVIVKALVALGMMDPPPAYDLAANYLIGQLALSAMTWEWADTETEALRSVSIEEWLESWFLDRDLSLAWAHHLLADLKVDGWQVGRG